MVRKIEKYSSFGTKGIGYSSLNAFIKQAEMNQIPISCYFEVTYQCNFKCIHCFADVPHCDTELNYKEILVVLDQLQKAGVLKIIFSGGEPFIRKDFLDIVQSARQRGFSVCILTNGTLITNKIAKSLSEFFLEDIMVTLYGPNDKSYRMVTGRSGMFKRAVRGIGLLYDYKLPVRVSTHLFNFYSAKDILAMRKICDKLGPGLKKISIEFKERKNGDLTALRYRVNESQLHKACQRVPEILSPWIFLTESSVSRPNLDKRICPSICTNIFISPSGNIGVCDSLVSKTNLRKKPLLDIWRNEPIFRKARQIRWRNIPECLSCKNNYFCKPCLGRNLKLNNNFVKNPSEFCDFMAMQKKVICKIQNSKK